MEQIYKHLRRKCAEAGYDNNGEKTGQASFTHWRSSLSSDGPQSSDVQREG